MYSIRILKSAAKELDKLDKSTGGRVVQRVRWLAENLDSVRLFPLKGELQGLFKLREGAYRIIFEINRDERVIIIHAIGHRREIYRKR